MKYKITNVTKKIKHPLTNKDVILHQIESLIDFTLINGKEIKVGDKGGWIESEKNLSQLGKCWIYENCMMFGKSQRSENSIGFGNSMQCGYSRQYGNSQQYGDSIQYDYSRQYGNSIQYEKSRQYGHSQQYDNSMQFGDSMQFGKSRQYGNSTQFGKSRQCEHSQQFGNSMQFDESHQFGNSKQYGYSKQGYNSKQKDNFEHSDGHHFSSSKSGKLTSERELIEFNSVGSHGRCINYDKTTKIININNCFIGKVDELEKDVKLKYGDEYTNYYDIIKIIRLIENNK